MSSVPLVFNCLRLLAAALTCTIVVQVPAYAQDRPQRGKVVYEGTYSGKQTEGFILFNQGPELVGAMTLTVEFDGSAIRATYKTTGKLAGGAATGLVEGDICKLFGSGNLTIEADCTGNDFKGKLFQQPKSELRRQVSFQLTRRSDSTISPGSIPPTSEPVSQSTAAVAVTTVPPSTGSQGSARPRLSELRDEDFIQNSSSPEEDPNNTRIPIAGNLMIDVAGKYPLGYKPAWRFITYKSQLSVTIEDWLRPQSQVSQGPAPLHIGDYGGKAVIRMSGGDGFDCFADLLIKSNFVVLTEVPQVFELGNFRRILNERSTGEPCVSRNAKGGFGGKVALSANKNGDIVWSSMVESYTLETRDRKNTYPPQVHMRYIAKNITIENEMSAAKANATVVAEQEAKQRQKDYLAKMTEQGNALQKAILAKYPLAESRKCFQSSKGAYLSSNTVDQYYVNSGNYAGSKTSYDIKNVVEIKNVCNHPITFIGIQQQRDEAQGYFLSEVTKTMPAGYAFKSDQGMLGTVLSALAGGGSEFDIVVQESYVPKYASLRSTQWIRVVKN